MDEETRDLVLRIPETFWDVDQNNLTDDEILELVECRGQILGYIRDRSRINYAMCLAAVIENADAMEYVPAELEDIALAMRATDTDIYAINHVSVHLLNTDLIRRILNAPSELVPHKEWLLARAYPLIFDIMIVGRILIDATSGEILASNI